MHDLKQTTDPLLSYQTGKCSIPVRIVRGYSRKIQVKRKRSLKPATVKKELLFSRAVINHYKQAIRSLTAPQQPWLERLLHKLRKKA